MWDVGYVKLKESLKIDTVLKCVTVRKFVAYVTGSINF